MSQTTFTTATTKGEALTGINANFTELYTAKDTVRAAITIQAGPASGAPALPTYRSLVAADIPDLSSTYLTPSAGDAAYEAKFGDVVPNYVLVGPVDVPAGPPSFRLLTNADIPIPGLPAVVTNDPDGSNIQGGLNGGPGGGPGAVAFNNPVGIFFDLNGYANVANSTKQTLFNTFFSQGISGPVDLSAASSVNMPGIFILPTQNFGDLPSGYEGCISLIRDGSTGNPGDPIFGGGGSTTRLVVFSGGVWRLV